MNREKRKLKVEILHDLKEFLKEFFKFYLFSKTAKAEIKNSLLLNNLALKCQIAFSKKFSYKIT